MNWDHLRTFEAIARLGSLTGASRSLGISQSSTSRHLARLEEIAGGPLVLRGPPLELTQRGLRLRESIAPMLHAALAAQVALEVSPSLRGEVTVSTVGEMLRWVLADRLPEFFSAHPHIRLRFLVDNQIASLAAGEADVSLRLFRPQSGDLVAQRILEVEYGLFAHADMPLSPQSPWLGLTGSLSRIPEQLAMEKAFGGRPARLLVEDLESLARAVELGLGMAVLPRPLAAGLSDVIEVHPNRVGNSQQLPPPTRGVWLVVHRSRARVARIRAVMDWIRAGIETSW